MIAIPLIVFAIARSLTYLIFFKDKYNFLYYWFAFYRFKNFNLFRHVFSDSIQALIAIAVSEIADFIIK